MTLKKALEEMARPHSMPAVALHRLTPGKYPLSDERRWELLSMVLREIALAKGIDLDCEFHERLI